MKLIDNRFATNLNFEVGDVIVCEYGELFIILHDEFDDDYPYAVAALNQMKVIEKYSTVEDCVQTTDGKHYIDGLRVIDVIPYDSVTLIAENEHE